MVHTLPDYTTKYRMVQVFGQIDSGELAARLNSPVIYDRRGNIVFMDNFETSDIKWRAAGTGTGKSQTISTARAWRGASSLKLVTGDTTNSTSYIAKAIALPSSTKIGLEARISPVSTDQRISLILYGYDGSKEYTGSVDWDLSNDKVYYLNSGGTLTELVDKIGANSIYKLWMPLKVVIDYATFKYVRVLVQNQEFDLSDQSLTSSGSGTYTSINAKIIATALSDANKTSYVDDVIVTQNEP